MNKVGGKDGGEDLRLWKITEDTGGGTPVNRIGHEKQKSKKKSAVIDVFERKTAPKGH